MWATKKVNLPPTHTVPKMSLLQYYMLKMQPLTTSGTLFYHKTSYRILKRPIRGVQIRPFYNIDFDLLTLISVKFAQKIGVLHQKCVFSDRPIDKRRGLDHLDF